MTAFSLYIIWWLWAERVRGAIANLDDMMMMYKHAANSTAADNEGQLWYHSITVQCVIVLQTITVQYNVPQYNEGQLWYHSYHSATCHSTMRVNCDIIPITVQRATVQWGSTVISFLSQCNVPQYNEGQLWYHSYHSATCHSTADYHSTVQCATVQWGSTVISFLSQYNVPQYCRLSQCNVPQYCRYTKTINTSALTIWQHNYQLESTEYSTLPSPLRLMQLIRDISSSVDTHTHSVMLSDTIPSLAKWQQR